LSHPSSNVSSGKFKVIAVEHGSIAYYIQGPEKYSRQTICEETYEEALKLVNE
jgi:hypothetical protein